MKTRLVMLVVAVVLVLGVAVILWQTAPLHRSIISGGGYLVRWEITHLPNKWLFKIGHLFAADLTQEEEDAILSEYFSISRDIMAVEMILEEERATESELTEALRKLRERRRTLENRVEDILEGRLTKLLEDEGLSRHLLFFSNLRFVFPPVDFEFGQPPMLLVVSPRTHIIRKHSVLLRPDLSQKDIGHIEREAERGGDMSAVVLELGGIAAYPTIIPETKSYPATLRTLAHEWIHHYLFFRPLGRSYFKNEELKTLNETVASLAGRELGRLLAERYPIILAPYAYPQTPQPIKPPDFNSQMRALRLEVDALLTQGKVEEAEMLMEEKRQFFAAHGIFIRKINQAYFAFYGTYALGPASIDPIGPKIEQLRNCSDSLGAFLRTVEHITSEEALDQLLNDQCLKHSGVNQ